MQVRAVAFDIGGVMVRIASTWAEAARVAGVPLGVSPGPLSGLREFGQYQSGELDDTAYLAALAGHLGTDVDSAARVHRGILIEAMPGVEALVAELMAAGLVCGCLSNTNALHWAPLAEDGTFPAIASMPVRVASHRVRASKPDQAIYRAFEEDAGATGSEVAYFDDVAEYVEGARTMGWRAWQVPSGAEPAAFMRATLAEFGVR